MGAQRFETHSRTILGTIATESGALATFLLATRNQNDESGQKTERNKNFLHYYNVLIY